MIKKLLLNGSQKHFSLNDLPLLIHAGEGAGGSLFSVSLVADLYEQGAKLLFLCGYPMARDEFGRQTDSASDSLLVTEESQLAEALGKRVIFVGKESPELFIKLTELLPDIDERVIFFKNFDLFDTSVFETIENLPLLVLMGDVEKCSYGNALARKKWTTEIYFSVPGNQLEFKLPEIPKYYGYMHSNYEAGLVTLG